MTSRDRRLGGAVLCSQSGNTWLYHAGPLLYIIFFFCQPTAKLFTGCCAVLQSSHTVLFAAISTCHVYSHRDSQNQEFFHNSHFWHAQEPAQINCVKMTVLSEEQEGQFRHRHKGEGVIGSSRMDVVWLKPEALPGDGVGSQGRECVFLWRWA